jgi:NAD-dependent deacetylase
VENIYQKIAALLVHNRNAVALTGAGISAESGIPTFRDRGGLWDKYDPMVYASIEMFRQDPSKYWQIRGEFIRNYDSYQPNAAHQGLAALENLGILNAVITQNIDGLHKKAGSINVLELHGSLRETYCLKCSREYIAPDLPNGMPPACECGGVLKPNTVLFGEQLPPAVLNKAIAATASCRLMLVIGTSSAVQPAASLPYLAQQQNAKLVEINPTESLDGADIFLPEKAGTAVPAIMQEVNKLLDR